ncbi:MAG: recombination protein RecR [Gammaproteobacteria bacterium]|nr:recombination protein RecR [Gammaproteobacteria bacterium]
MSSSLHLDHLIDALTCLPGVGKKSAQRMALHLLERDRDGAKDLSAALIQALDGVKHCQQCRNYADTEECAICASPQRDRKIMCVVETPADVMALEASASFRGQYFVLLGKLSPLDGIGPEQLGINLLEERLRQGEISELILATNPTVEGEITAQFIADIARPLGVKTSRIAHGVPVGGELEYIDGGTLSRALSGRTQFD